MDYSSIVFFLVITNNSHHLIWSVYHPAGFAYQTLVYLRGPLYWLHVSYSYVMLLMWLFCGINTDNPGSPLMKLVIVFLAFLPPIFCNFLLAPFTGH